MEPSGMERKTGSFQVRRAVFEDAALLAALGRQTFAAAFGADNNPEDLARHLAQTFSKEQQEREFAQPENIYLIAESEGNPAGYARLHPGPAPDSIPGSSPVELVRFYLLPAYIGQGFGSRLMRVCLDLAWGGGHDVMWLSTWKKNARGLDFYKKWGFQIVGEQIFMVGKDPQEDWLLALRRGDQSAS